LALFACLKIGKIVPMVRTIRYSLFSAFIILCASCSDLLFPGKAGFKKTSYILPPGAIITTQTFTLVGGFKIPAEFTSSGIGLVTNSAGETIKIVVGNHTYEQAMSVYDIRGKQINIALTNYLQLTKEVTLTRANLFPYWDNRHDLRDYFITSSANGVHNRICGVGRMYYNTNPQLTTNIHCTQVNDNFTSIGNAEKIPVNIPEQWVTGFGGSETRLWGGAYDSGQGTTMGPVLASRADNGQWNILYRAPDLGNFSNAIPLLPRPQGYNCTDGNSWVCHAPIPFAPTNDVYGVWTTERIAGGGVEIGDVAMILPTLGFGERNYANQSYTFGPANLDKSYAYYFRKNANGKYEFLNYDDWPFSNQGENIIGMKIGKLEGRSGLYLFVVRSNAYYYGLYKAGSVVDIFKISAQ
jgi:hypothetical protein